MTADLLLHGGEIIDPESQVRRRADVSISDGKIQAVGLKLPRSGTTVDLDVSGLIVTPGLVDLHAHVFVGQDLAVDPNVHGPATGTTTFVDAGSTGAHLFEAFRKGTIEPAIPRIVAFLNVATIGTTSTELAGELEYLPYSNEDVCVSCASQHPELILGVKVRASGDVVGPHGAEPVRRARRAAERLGLPLMVHIGGPPPDLDPILFYLRSGDIVTHCCTGYGNRLANATVRSVVTQARDRGVLFDVGHGMGSFDVEVATTLLAAGFVPDTISTDISSYALEAGCDFPTVLAKFLALGMTLEEVIRRATLEPARALGLDRLGVGTMRVGAPADIAVFSLEEGPVIFHDTSGRLFEGQVHLGVRVTVQNGVIVHDKLATNPVAGRVRPASS